jgi:hypothetical protein
VIYVRSRKSIVTLGALGLVAAVVFGVVTLVAVRLPEAGGWVAGIALGAGALGGSAVAIWAAIQAQAWPSSKLGLFRDRIVVVHGRHEMRALWDVMESVTLSEPDSWPKVRVTDRLTIRLRNEPPLGFKPADFGLEPSACRDLILRLRDDAGLRSRLPEFDSVRDLAVTPIVSGELIKPRL